MNKDKIRIIPITIEELDHSICDRCTKWTKPTLLIDNSTNLCVNCIDEFLLLLNKQVESLKAIRIEE